MEPVDNLEGIDDSFITQEHIEDLIKLKEMPGWGILQERLKSQVKQALVELVDTDATDVKKITSLQNEVKRYYWFAGTIEQLIQQGLDIERRDEEVAGDLEFGEPPDGEET